MVTEQMNAWAWVRRHLASAARRHPGAVRHEPTLLYETWTGRFPAVDPSVLFAHLPPSLVLGIALDRGDEPLAAYARARGAVAPAWPPLPPATTASAPAWLLWRKRTP